MKLVPITERLYLDEREIKSAIECFIQERLLRNPKGEVVVMTSCIDGKIEAFCEVDVEIG